MDSSDEDISCENSETWEVACTSHTLRSVPSGYLSIPRELIIEDTSEYNDSARSSSVYRQESISRDIVNRVRSTGRQFSHSTKNFLGVGQDEEEYNLLNRKWVAKHRAVYGQYKSVLFGRLKSPYAAAQQPQLFSNLIVDHLANFDDNASVFASNPATPSALNANRVFLPPVVNRTFSKSSNQTNQTNRVSSTSTNISSNPKVMRKPSVMELGKKAFYRTFSRTKPEIVDSSYTPNITLGDSVPAVDVEDNTVFKIISRDKEQHVEEGKGGLKTRRRINKILGMRPAERGWRVEPKIKTGIPRKKVPGIVEQNNGNFRVYYQSTKRLDSHIREQLTGLCTHRPYFSFWITIVQIMVMLITIFSYGIGPIGFGYRPIDGYISRRTLEFNAVRVSVPENIWIGPNSTDLIKIGAKYSPCMRMDNALFAELLVDREQEFNSGCCQKSDACFQAVESDCTGQFLRFLKYDEPGRGPVCGQDRNYCLRPSDVEPHTWPNNITDWPICRESDVPSFDKDLHMSCKVVAKPCCVGVRGTCIIATEVYCHFVGGVYHPEASLCSQVHCWNEVCGLYGFYKDNEPDQIYRIFTSLFIHAGLIQLIITCVFQFTLLKYVEVLCGPLRVAIIYFVSGIGGTLLSAIVLPYQAQVGPSACQFGILGCYVVELIQLWSVLESQMRAFGCLAFMLSALFLLGLLPWIDNYMNFGGLVYGMLLAFILVPSVNLNKKDRLKKIIFAVLAFFVVILFFCLSLVFFVFKQVAVPKFLEYLTCIPLGIEFCNQVETKIIVN